MQAKPDVPSLLSKDSSISCYSLGKRSPWGLAPWAHRILPKINRVWPTFTVGLVDFFHGLAQLGRGRENEAEKENNENSKYMDL